jgi:hypothetical protein
MVDTVVWFEPAFVDRKKLEWLALTQEAVIEPERPIVDCHHHLWDARGPLAHQLKKVRACVRACVSRN